MIEARLPFALIIQIRVTYIAIEIQIRLQQIFLSKKLKETLSRTIPQNLSFQKISRSKDIDIRTAYFLKIKSSLPLAFCFKLEEVLAI